MDNLLRVFQQRHLLAHCEGILDQNYIEKSGDTTYAVGQRLVIQDGAVTHLAEILVKLTGEMRKLV